MSRLSMSELVSWICLLVICWSGHSIGQQQLVYQVLEEQNAFTPVGDVKTDSGLSNKYNAEVLETLKFSVLNQPQQEQSYFTIDEESGILKTKQTINRDKICPQRISCRLPVDIAVSPANYFQVIKVSVDVSDINDNAPQFAEQDIVKGISEAADIGAIISLPLAADLDSPENGVLKYELISQSSLFQLRETKQEFLTAAGEIELVLTGSLDREVVDTYLVKIVAYDTGSPALSSTMTVNVRVDDANDHTPKFSTPSYNVTVPESLGTGEPITRVLASDRDIGTNGQIVYGFTSATLSKYGDIFDMREATGEITLKQELDYEEKKSYDLVVTAKDKGADAKVITTQLQIHVTDVNDNSPKITLNLLGSRVAGVEENSKVGQFVAHISVLDLDSGKNGEVSCSLNNPHFRLEMLDNVQNQYKIVTTSVLDREKQATYDLKVICTDDGSPSQTAALDIVVAVTDLNEHRPTFSSATFTATVPENRHIGTEVVRLNASDMDSGDNARISFRLHADARDLFSIDSSMGIVRTNAVFDYEHVTQVTFHVTAIDHGNPPMSSAAMVVVNIADQNDESPLFQKSLYNFTLTENNEIGYFIGQVAASDKDTSQFNKFTFSFQFAPDDENIEKFTIDKATGEIFAIKSLDRETFPVYKVIVKATNVKPPYLSSTATVKIALRDYNDNSPVFEYPLETNNTVHISSFVPRSYTVTNVKAVDADVGNNSKIIYSIWGGNKNQSFKINPNNGTLMTNIDLKTITYHVYSLELMAADEGTPMLTALTTLKVVVNNAIPYTSSEVKTSSSNLVILIVLVCVSSIVIVTLALSIVLMFQRMKRGKQYQKQHVYSLEAQKAGIANPGYINGKGQGGKQDVDASFQVEHEADLKNVQLVKPKGSWSDDVGLTEQDTASSWSNSDSGNGGSDHEHHQNQKHGNGSSNCERPARENLHNSRDEYAPAQYTVGPISRPSNASVFAGPPTNDPYLFQELGVAHLPGIHGDRIQRQSSHSTHSDSRDQSSIEYGGYHDSVLATDGRTSVNKRLSPRTHSLGGHDIRNVRFQEGAHAAQDPRSATYC